MDTETVNERDVLRHLLAALAYRGGKCLRDAPAGFGDFGPGKPALAILAHMGDLLEWSLSLAQGEGGWRPAVPGDWAMESARFHRGLENLDRLLASETPLAADWRRLLQGPLADALTHVGQLALLRRLAGAPLADENYFRAEMVAGRLGPDQAPPARRT
jgi:hypothetical protein